ncbi:unnamed protein product [Amoebophrya sp. A120]|nr:unnamed protein product [Amoebophrya sp. A120]|eukprot:GSA120T00018465001.1
MPMAAPAATSRFSASDLPPLPPAEQLLTVDFLSEQMTHCMNFFSVPRCTDDVNGGFYHFYAEDGEVFDTRTKLLVTQARFVFSYAKAHEQLSKTRAAAPMESYLKAVMRGINYLFHGPLRNPENGAYFWSIREGPTTDPMEPLDLTMKKVPPEPLDSRIYTYGLAQCLLAYSAALKLGVKEARKMVDETWDTLEAKMWDAENGLYAEEADDNWNWTSYRSESGNLHMTEALLETYAATKDLKFFRRALLIADNICRRQVTVTRLQKAVAGTDSGAPRKASKNLVLEDKYAAREGGTTCTTESSTAEVETMSGRLSRTCLPLIWEHYDEKWEPVLDFTNTSKELEIFRPWGFQPGHQVEWARFLLELHEIGKGVEGCEQEWLLPKARNLFHLAVKYAWDVEKGGLAYSLNLDGSICNYDKIFWVQSETLGTCVMLLAMEEHNDLADPVPVLDEYSKAELASFYEKLWIHSWKYSIDHIYGSWRRRLSRDHVPYFSKKTKLSLCVDPDFHMMGAFSAGCRALERRRKQVDKSVQGSIKN